MPKKNTGKIADKNEICEHLTEFMRNPDHSENTRLGAARELVKLVGYAPEDAAYPESSVNITDERFRRADSTCVP